MTDAIDELIAREAGYVDHPADRGGPTKYGITLATLMAWRSAPVTAEDVKALTVEEARLIYLSMYATGLERIEHHPDLYRFMLDISVMSGTRTAIRLLQIVANGLMGTALVVDGVLGPATAAVIDQASIPTLIQALVTARVPALIRLVERDPSQLVFLEGWVVRTLAFLPESVA